MSWEKIIALATEQIAEESSLDPAGARELLRSHIHEGDIRAAVQAIARIRQRAAANRVGVRAALRIAEVLLLRL